MSDAATLSILIDIRSRLDEIDKTQREMRGLTDETKKAGQEANSLNSAFRTGFGIEIARRGMNLLTQTLRANVTEALRLASYTKDVAQNLSINTEPLQVLALLVKDAGGDFENLNQGIVAYRAQLSAARTGTGAAANEFRKLNLNAEALVNLPLEQQLEIVAKRMLVAGNGTIDFDAAVTLLGRRNAPKLMQALKELAEQGYDKVAKSAKDAGQVMEQDTIDRLDRAQKNIEKLKRKIIIDVGEGLGALELLRQSAMKAPGSTLFGLLKAAITGDYTNLGQTIAANVPPGKQSTKPQESPVQLALAQTPAWQQAQLALLKATNDQAVIENDITTTEAEKKSELVEYLWAEIEARQILLKLAQNVPLSDNETQAQRDLLIEQLGGDVNQSVLRKGNRLHRESAFEQRINTEGYANTENPVANKNYLSLGEGVNAGMGDWVTQLGSRGEQVAATLQATLGQAVQGISDGIYGWITGTETFGNVLLNLGDMIFRTLIQTIVQMGVQMLINAVLARTLQAAAISANIVAATAQAATLSLIWSAPATLATIATYGGAAAGAPMAIMAAKLTVLASAASGFAEGGFTGYGGKYEVAGPVHRGEVVYSQADIMRHGGVEAVEAMRVGGPEALMETMAVPMPVPVSPISVGAPLAAAALAAGAAAGRRKQKNMQVFLIDKRSVSERMRDDANCEVYIREIIMNNPGSFGIPT